jgi:26S proteasome regulatory subunit N13
MDASSIIQNFINSIPGGKGQQLVQQPDRLFTTLADLLTPASTLPLIESADTETLDRFLQYLPPTLVGLAQEADDAARTQTAANVEASKDALSLDQKKDILRRVLRSPQFSQSLSSLTIALRDGGLPSISEALNIPVRNGGYMRRGAVPLGGGDAVEAFLDGVKDSAEKEKNPGDSMETD